MFYENFLFAVGNGMFHVYYYYLSELSLQFCGVNGTATWLSRIWLPSAVGDIAGCNVLVLLIFNIEDYCLYLICIVITADERII